ncbi:MAG TPA: hypothetical protein VFP38_16440 [Bradyrhizobium sp.]|nr:hypothetical protein [Bradyrhizobium sp.]
MLEADSAVAQYEQWLARNLEIAVCHRNGRFLMRAGEEFRFLIAAIVDQRFMQPAKALCRIARQVRDIERLDNIDHEVGARHAGGLR